MNGAAMTTSHQKPETIARGARMLRTALGTSIARFLEDPAVVEVMLNPDGRIWVDRLSEGLADTGERLSAARYVNTQERKKASSQKPIASSLKKPVAQSR